MIKSEGRQSELPERRAEPTIGGRQIKHGSIVQVQDTAYDVKAAEAEANEARQKMKKNTMSTPAKRKITRAHPEDNDKNNDDDGEFHGTHDIRTAPLDALDPKTNEPKFSQSFCATYTSMCYTHGFAYKKDSACPACIKARELTVKSKAKKALIALKLIIAEIKARGK